MKSKSPESIVRRWWTLIDRRDFEGATRLCSSAAVIDWPLSNERMASIQHWKSINEHYPGQWNASITELIAQGDSVVTVARVFNDDASVTAISFFTIRAGLIEKGRRVLAGDLRCATRSIPMDCADIVNHRNQAGSQPPQAIVG